MVASSARARFRSTLTGLTARERLAATCLAGLLCLLLVSRLAGLGLSLWADEVTTVVRFVQPGPAAIWGSYSPNNHVLFSLLTWLSTLVLGTSEAIVRLWAVVPGLLAVGILTGWAWQRLGPGTAVVVALLATTAPTFLDLHTQARGYGLTTLAAVLLIVVADRLVRRHPGRWLWAAYGGVALLGVFAHLAFVVGYLAQSLTLLAFRRLRRGVVVSGLCVGLAAAVFYGPLLGQMTADLSRAFGDTGSLSTPARYAALTPSGLAEDGKAEQSTGERSAKRYTPLPWYAALTGPPSLVAPSVEVVVRNQEPRACQKECYKGSAFLWVVPVLICWLVGVAELWRRGRREVLVLLAAPPAVAFLLLTLPQGYVVDRFLSYTVPYTLVLVSIGIVAIGKRLSAVRLVRPLVLASAALVTVVGLVHFAALVERRSRIPYENPRQVARVIDRWGGERVLTNSTRPLIFYYYLGRDRVQVKPQRRKTRRRDAAVLGRTDALKADALRAALCSAAAPFAFIHHFPLRAPPAPLDCLARRPHERVQVKQRGRGGWIDVYLVGKPVDRSSPASPLRREGT